MVLASGLSTAALTCGRLRSRQARAGRLVPSTGGQTLMTAAMAMCVKLTDDLLWEMNFQLALSLRALHPHKFICFSGGW